MTATDHSEQAATKITKLTPEQEAELPRFRQHYLDLACNGSRIDRGALQSALADAYTVIGKPAPTLFIFDSPAACMLALKIFAMGDSPAAKISLGDQLGDQLWGQLWGQLWDQLWDQLRDQLRDQLGDQLGGQLIWNPNFLWGAQDLYWIAWGRFAQHIGVKLELETDRRLGIMERISTQCEWWWPYENIVVASEKPTIVRWDDQRRLHGEDRAAVEYADGYNLFAWHGVRVPAAWIEGREELDPVEVLKNHNVELKAAGRAIIGMARFRGALKGRVIDDSGSPDIGKLVEYTIPGLPEPGLYLEAECPRNGTICEGVPRISEIDGLPINTAIAAQAWRIGDPQSEYTHPPMRT